jgi:DNA-binding GntR family transcriptional regulator
MSKTGLTPIVQDKDSLVDRVSDTVRQSIIDGNLRPAEALSISDIAADLGVSHSPVREALQRLSGQGLVELRQARSAIVAPLDVDDLIEIYRLRKLIEVDAAARACPLLQEADVALAREELGRLVDGPADTESFWEHHDAFHRVLMRPVSSERLSRITDALWQAAQRYVRIAYTDPGVFAAMSPRERHEPLFEAAESRSSSQMRKAMLAHLETNECEIVQHVQAMLDGD